MGYLRSLRKAADFGSGLKPAFCELRHKVHGILSLRNLFNLICKLSLDAGLRGLAKKA